jgi:predicted DNA-binding transcriptional regulator AlpA
MSISSNWSYDLVHLTLLSQAANPWKAAACLMKVPSKITPRGLCREEAAAYIGVGTSKFDQMVADGRMPRPKVIDARVVWDRHRLDIAFEDLPDREARNPWDRDQAA